MSRKKLFLLALLVLAFVLFFALDLHTYFDLAYFQAQRQQIEALVAEHRLGSALIFFVIYVTVTALSLPAAAVLTVAGGALFGLGWGLLLVSFASSLGASLAFLFARTLLRDWVQARFGTRIQAIDRGVEKDGAFYLFTLRLVPLFPFFLINLAMGLTRMRLPVFYGVSQLGMLPGTALYVNVGAQLGQATSLPQVLSLPVLLSLLAIALFPWLARGVVTSWRQRRRLAGWTRPRRFDANMVVIGAGAAGLVSSLIGALVKGKVVLVERDAMGGDCLNTGCVPSKALIRSAACREELRRAAEYGIVTGPAETDFSAVMARIRQVIARIAPKDSVERYTALGVDCVQGEAAITSPWTVTVNGREIHTRHIVLATGARPRIPDIPGLSDIPYLTSDSLWRLQALPEHLLVIGGGPIGCELAQAFVRLGSQVTLLQRAGRLLPSEDEEVSALVEARFREAGIKVICDGQMKAVRRYEEAIEASWQTVAGESAARVSHVLLAVGRQANVEGLGLDALGISLNEKGRVAVDDHLQTACPTVYACGDVVGPWQFTHMASHQAWYASVNCLFGLFRRFRINYRIVPRAIFIDPEVARVGLNEIEASADKVPYELSHYPLQDHDRAIADGQTQGFIKVLTVPGRDRILGVTIVSSHASDLLTPFILAMTHGLGLKKLMSTIHVYPSWSEANKFVAGEWQKAHSPDWVLPWLERLHRWRRH